MTKPTNSFDLMPDVYKHMPRINPRWLNLWRVVYGFKAFIRHIRILKPVTMILGRQYRRSRDMIEIDITYQCNLKCLNCNRSVTQAPDTMHMPVDQVSRFVNDSIKLNKHWRRIRILGGEPTLHPYFKEIVNELLRYKKRFNSCMVEVVSNGLGSRAQNELENLPPEIMIDTTSFKTSTIQPYFAPFNMAPIDDVKFKFTDFSNGCAIMRDCGIGLTPLGYYPCAVAGGIDRILEEGWGLQELPADFDNMEKAAARLCSLCGRFRNGHFVPRILRPKLEVEKISTTWQMLYERWRKRKETNEDIDLINDEKSLKVGATK